MSNAFGASNHWSPSHLILVQKKQNPATSVRIEFSNLVTTPMPPPRSCSGPHIKGFYIPHSDKLLCLIRHLICWSSNKSHCVSPLNDEPCKIRHQWQHITHKVLTTCIVTRMLWIKFVNKATGAYKSKTQKKSWEIEQPKYQEEKKQDLILILARVLVMTVRRNAKRVSAPLRSWNASVFGLKMIINDVAVMRKMCAGHISQLLNYHTMVYKSLRKNCRYTSPN